MQDDNQETKVEITRKIKVEIKCILNGCGEPATKKFILEKSRIHSKWINVCDNCFDKLMSQQKIQANSEFGKLAMKRSDNNIQEGFSKEF